MTTKPLNSYKIITYDKIRYSDTDKHGHVNNAVFSMYFETPRLELLYPKEIDLRCDGCQFVIVNTNINYLKEIQFPGIIKSACSIQSIGKSSITFIQALFQDDILVSNATSVIVQIDMTTKQSIPLSKETVSYLTTYLDW